MPVAVAMPAVVGGIRTSDRTTIRRSGHHTVARTMVVTPRSALSHTNAGSSLYAMMSGVI